MAPTFAEISKARCILLTTFTKDGRPKPTAADVQRAITERYGPFGRLLDVYLKLRGVEKKSIGIELKAA